MNFLFCLFIVGAFARSQRRPLHIRGRLEIVGGTAASPGEFPYQLSFQEEHYGQGYHFCGASLYQPGVAICSGQCVDGQDLEHPDSLSLVAGEYDLLVESGDEQRVQLRKITLHEEYDKFTDENDISLLFTSKDFVYNSLVGPVKLPAQGQEFSGNFIVAGWGVVREGQYNMSSILEKVTVPYVNATQCHDDYPEDLVTDSMICAGATGVGSCLGDSGGPLTQGDVQVGIVSWGAGCSFPGKPGVYTKVSYFVDWIQAHLND